MDRSPRNNDPANYYEETDDDNGGSEDENDATYSPSEDGQFEQSQEMEDGNEAPAVANSSTRGAPAAPTAAPVAIFEFGGQPIPIGPNLFVPFGKRSLLSVDSADINYTYDLPGPSYSGYQLQQNQPAENANFMGDEELQAAFGNGLGMNNNDNTPSSSKDKRKGKRPRSPSPNPGHSRASKKVKASPCNDSEENEDSDDDEPDDNESDDDEPDDDEPGDDEPGDDGPGVDEHEDDEHGDDESAASGATTKQRGETKKRSRNPSSKKTSSRTSKNVKTGNRDAIENADGSAGNPVESSGFTLGDRGYDHMLPYINRIPKMFEELVSKGAALGLIKVLDEVIQQKALLIGTMCSGSEAPILGLLEVQRVLRWMYQRNLFFSQQFAAEIQPAKAAFIERNGTTKVILRDIIEFVLGKYEQDGSFHATTSYGGKTIIQGSLDMLIAGFACDDFSLMNNHRKTLEEKGESGDTFHAIIEYLRNFKPALVILENICNAPWLDEKLAGNKRTKKGRDKQTGIDKHLESVGYRTVFCRVDSKNFYVPHTRQRGYMLAVRADRISEDEMKSKAVVFEKVFRSLGGRPSAPAEAFLFASDDPQLEVLKVKCEAVTKRGRISWDKCRVGHDNYRDSEHLGLLHPITQWKSDGSRRLPDFFRPFQGMSERVCDSIDIAHLRNLRRFVDDRYYSRILELSQNVYRVMDVTKNGVIGCCMPSNMLWATVDGRRITGLEALIFQATPVHLASYNNMSETILHDLAGNAMTSTVVTSFALAAIMVFHEVLDLAEREDHELEPEPETDFESSNATLARDVFPADYELVSVSEIVQLAAETQKMCYCELQNEVCTSAIQECQTCKQTTCLPCGREPVHDYTTLPQSFTTSRKDPTVFERKIRASISNEIDIGSFMGVNTTALLAELQKVKPQSLSNDEWLSTIELIQKALGSKVFLRSVRRSWKWEIVFDSSDAKLQLCISAHDVKWELYSNIPNEPLGSPKGKYLRRFPIAKMVPTGDDILKGNWSFWVPRKEIFPAIISSYGELIPTFEAERGLVEKLNDRVHSRIYLKFVPAEPGSEISQAELLSKYIPREIEGLYTASPACGQAFNSHHAHNVTASEVRPLGMFREHTHYEGTPENGRYVISEHFERLDHGVYRPLLAEVFGWEQPIVRIDDEDIGYGIPSKSYNQPIERQAHIVIHGYWKPLLNYHAQAPRLTKISQRQIGAEISQLGTDSCGYKTLALGIEVDLPYELPGYFVRNQWQLVDRSIQGFFWTELRWLLSKSAILDGHKESDSVWHPLPDDRDRCLTCAPYPPALLWTYKATIRKLASHEDHKEASDFEAIMRSRPSAFDVVFRVDVAGHFSLKIGIDPWTLAHRAKALLFDAPSLSEVGLSWRLVTDDCKYGKPILLSLTIPSTKDILEGPDPLLDPPTHLLKLLPGQNRVLQWMKQREDNPPVFAQQEIVEELLRDIGYRLEGMATSLTTVRGGVLAQGVGFGKTIVTIALIAASMRAKAASEAASEGGDDNSSEPSGRIPTNATLIIVPSHLCDQWSAEIQKFMPLPAKVIVIKNIKDWKACSLEDFVKADIVIVDWTIFSSPAYIDCLSQFAGMIPPACSGSQMNDGRLMRTWYQAALEKALSNLASLRSDPKSFMDDLKKQFSESAEKATSINVPVPSKHVTGAAYQNSEARKAARLNEERLPAAAKADPKFKSKFKVNSKNFLRSSIALFELFRWARIAIDEYTYLSTHLRTAVQMLVALRKWILSGTTPTRTFNEIKQIAELLGIYLGVDDLSFLDEDVRAKKLENLTSSEQMLALIPVSSAAARQRRHELAQELLNLVATCDQPDANHIGLNEVIVLISPSPAERAVYCEQQQDLVPNEFVGRKISSHASHRERAVHDLGFQPDGKQALLMRASNFSNFETAANGDGTNIAPLIAVCRGDEVENTLEEFKREFLRGLCLEQALRESGRSEDTKSFNDYIGRILSNRLGDLSATQELSEAIDHARRRLVSNTWKEFYYRAEQEANENLRKYPKDLSMELRGCTSILNRKSNELLPRLQGCRFFEQVVSIQNLNMTPREASNELPVCDCCLEDLIDPRELEVLSRCGHIICHTCLATQQDDVCTNCRAQFNPAFQRINGSYLRMVSTTMSTYGSKIDQIVKLIKSWSPKEKVLLFVQFELTETNLKGAFDDNDITYANLRNTADASEKMEEFKSSEDLQVMIMEIGDSSAAGGNCQVASKIIFAQPYYTTGSSAQKVYEAAKTQAIGRSRRFGQTKTVEVYHFLTEHTIDIDYFEAREKKHIQRAQAPDSTSAFDFGSLSTPAPGITHGPLCSSTVNFVSFDDV